MRQFGHRIPLIVDFTPINALNAVVVLDFISTFAFAWVGARVAATKNMDYGGTPIYAAVVLGVLSGVLGGLTRDVLCQVPPVLLHRETSGTVSVLGAVVYVALFKSGADSPIAALISGVLIVLLRLLSVKLKINLPKVN